METPRPRLPARRIVLKGRLGLRWVRGSLDAGPIRVGDEDLAV
jgi:hypothetical protein